MSLLKYLLRFLFVNYSMMQKFIPVYSKLSVGLIFFCSSVFVVAQNFIPGNTYIDATGYVEYRAGNLPIVISAPHGGYLEPSTIPDRSCTGCVTSRDSFTQEVSDGIYNSIVTETGCYPHLIINLLHRKKFDANRDVQDAADGDPTVIQTWTNYHNFIDVAKAQVVQDYGTGTFYDMHGHGHTIQRIELGYLLTRTELQQNDNYINTNTDTQDTSIRTLVNSNLQNLTQAQLIRGSSSFGDILKNRGYHTVPSSSDPAPQGTEPYFAGGYNTRRHGSSDNISPISAIQIEMNSSIRISSANRATLIDSLAVSILDYHGINYNSQFANQYCALLSNDEIIPHKKTTIFPNPSSDKINFNTTQVIKSFVIYDAMGKVVLNNSNSNNQVDISKLKSGMYFLNLQSENGSKETTKFVKVND